MEQKQARWIMDKFGQAFWPDIVATLHLNEPGKSVDMMPMDTFSKAAALMERQGSA